MHFGVVLNTVVEVIVVGIDVVTVVVDVVVVIPVDNDKDDGGGVVNTTKGEDVNDISLEKSNTGGFGVVGTWGIHGTHGPDVVVVVVEVGGSVVSII